MELHLETNDTSLELLLPRFKEHTEAKNCNLQIFEEKNCQNEGSSALFKG